MASAREVDGNTVLDLGDRQVTLRGVSLDSLHRDDFVRGESIPFMCTPSARHRLSVA